MNKPQFTVENKKNKIKFELDLKLYDLDVVYGAAYYLVDGMYIYLTESSDENNITVHLKGKEDLSKNELEKIAGRFLNELINVGFRYQISEKNNKIREYIAGAALAGASTEIKSRIKKNRDSQKSNPEWVKDPDDIAVPWEEKNNQNTKKGEKLYEKTEDGMVVPWKKKEK